MAVVRSVAHPNAPAYQGSGLEKSAPAANSVSRSSSEAPEAVVAAPEIKRAEKSPEGAPIEIQEKQNNNNESIKRAVEEILKPSSKGQRLNFSR